MLCCQELFTNLLPAKKNLKLQKQQLKRVREEPRGLGGRRWTRFSGSALSLRTRGEKRAFFSMRLTVAKARGEGKCEREEGGTEMKEEESRHDEEMQGGESKQRD